MIKTLLNTPCQKPKLEIFAGLKRTLTPSCLLPPTKVKKEDVDEDLQDLLRRVLMKQIDVFDKQMTVMTKAETLLDKLTMMLDAGYDVNDFANLLTRKM
jgi:hypothetical protein